jgi:Methyltransferase domain
MVKAWRSNPLAFAEAWKQVPTQCRAFGFSSDYRDFSSVENQEIAPIINPLWDFFQNHKTGHGVWNYFEIYHRHLSKFIGRSPDVLEIGIYSGGSLEMWHSYFGEGSHIYGVDIQPACTAYESEHVSVLIGDQADRRFWGDCKRKIQGIDILIDDGGHTVEQQRITLEEMLPYLRPGGVYLCEDVHGRFNRFACFAACLVNGLNEVEILSESPVLTSAVSHFQRSIHSIHFYPYVTVIEKNRAPVTRLSAPKHGTQWQPFL